jgi:hypothetical protein
MKVSMMPTPTEILQTLTSISNEQQLLAMIWHGLFAVVVISLLFGWRPGRKLGATALVLPLLSVSVLAWLYKNPFNGVVFLLAAVVLAIIGSRRSPSPVEKPPAWATAIGALLVAFGWVYPHFLEGASWIEYFFRAPTGLIPCPTLSLVIGFALLAKGFSSRSWSNVLGILGIFYSLFGALRLGVTLDIGLLIGAVALIVLVNRRSRRDGPLEAEKAKEDSGPRTGKG